MIWQFHSAGAPLLPAVIDTCGRNKDAVFNSKSCLYREIWNMTLHFHIQTGKIPWGALPSRVHAFEHTGIMKSNLYFWILLGEAFRTASRRPLVLLFVIACFMSAHQTVPSACWRWKCGVVLGAEQFSTPGVQNPFHETRVKVRYGLVQYLRTYPQCDNKDPEQRYWDSRSECAPEHRILLMSSQTSLLLCFWHEKGARITHGASTWSKHISQVFDPL